MPRKSDAKQKLIDAAATLFKRHGYNGAGLNQILAESGAPKGSFYYHFPDGKEELAEAVVLREGAAISRLINKAFDEASDFETGVRTMAGFIAKWFKASGYAEGCPITAVLLVQVPDSSRLHAACRDVLADWSNTVAAHARCFELTERAELLGDAMVLAIEGAWILSRATQTVSPFDAASSMIIAIASAAE